MYFQISLMQKSLINIVNAVPRSPLFQFKEPVNWTLKEKEHWVFLGPNGTGKTLLAKIIRGEIPLKEGEANYHFTNNSPIYAKIKLASFRDIYSLADYHSFYYQQRWNSTEEETPVVIDILRKEWTDEEINSLVSAFNVHDLLTKNLILLSSGELRKFLLIRMLLSKPKVLILDNPYIGLDKQSRKLFNNLLRNISETNSIHLILLLSDPIEIPDWINKILPIYYPKKVGHPLSREEYVADKALEKELYSTKNIKILNLIHNPFSKGNKLNGDSVIIMDDIRIKYGDKFILKNLSWRVRQGEKWALLGRNGAGKSTLLSLVYADNPQSYANNFELFGRKRGSGESIWEIKERIGFVSPEFHLYYKGDRSCQEIIASGFFDYQGLYKKSNEQQMSLALKWMELTSVNHLQNCIFSQVSFGEQRMIILLRAFVKNPDLLILDEPLHGLDKENKKIVLSMVDLFCKQPDKTLIYVTHYENEIPESITQRKILIKN